MKRPHRPRRSRQAGAAIIEWLIVMALVVFGGAVLMAPLGKYLLAYNDRIESSTSLPLP